MDENAGLLSEIDILARLDAVYIVKPSSPVVDPVVIDQVFKSCMNQHYQFGIQQSQASHKS